MAYERPRDEFFFDDQLSLERFVHGAVGDMVGMYGREAGLEGSALDDIVNAGMQGVYSQLERNKMNEHVEDLNWYS